MKGYFPGQTGKEEGIGNTAKLFKNLKAVSLNQ
jgi:hypothetical protein